MVLENFQKFHDNGTTTVTQSKVARPTVVRKKFAKPPVKVACLSWYVILLLYGSGHPGRTTPGFWDLDYDHAPCETKSLSYYKVPCPLLYRTWANACSSNSRASRTRCDGQDPCSNVGPLCLIISSYYRVSSYLPLSLLSFLFFSLPFPFAFLFSFLPSSYLFFSSLLLNGVCSLSLNIYPTLPYTIPAKHIKDAFAETITSMKVSR